MAPELLAGLIMIVVWRMAICCTHYNDPACTNLNPLDGDYYLNEWVIKIKGNVNDAKRIAQEVGLQYLTPVEKYENYHKIRYTGIPYRHKLTYDLILQKLRNHKEIELAGQRYVWQPTINDMDNYEDMVGCERPVNVQISHFDAAKVISKRELEGDFRHRDDFRKPEPIDDETLPPLRSVVDLQEMYEKKQEEINELEGENQDNDTDNQIEETETSAATEQINRTEKPASDEKNQFIQQDEESKIPEVISEADENLKPSVDDNTNEYLNEKQSNEKTLLRNQEKTDQFLIVEPEKNEPSKEKLQLESPTVEQSAQ